MMGATDVVRRFGGDCQRLTSLGVRSYIMLYMHVYIYPLLRKLPNMHNWHHLF